LFIEKAKDLTVSGLMHRRGKFQKQIWHGSVVGLTAVGVLTSGTFGGNSLVASSFPGMGNVDPRYIETFDPNASGISLDSLINFKTDISVKPRAETIEHEVQSGETLSTIGQKYDIDSDTIKWANSLTSESIKPGQKLKILPVSGVAHKVVSGDTLDSVAKKYSAEKQGIVDFPFNDIGDDFRLAVGQTLIVPDGIPPEVKNPPKPKVTPQYIAKGVSNSPTFNAPGGGNFVWPTSFAYISQYFAWYHPALDLPSPAAPPVVASDGGTVIVAGWPDNYGYGNRVVIDHGNGYQTLYAHLSNIYVNSGQSVSRGQAIGKMGSTGRSTGTHLHFEIHFKGIAVNPLAILR
jgi:murein DD-endopeptidase MepM/ murein hydrolase activator NlpD